MSTAKEAREALGALRGLVKQHMLRRRLTFVQKEDSPKDWLSMLAIVKAALDRLEDFEHEAGRWADIEAHARKLEAENARLASADRHWRDMLADCATDIAHHYPAWARDIHEALTTALRRDLTVAGRAYLTERIDTAREALAGTAPKEREP